MKLKQRVTSVVLVLLFLLQMLYVQIPVKALDTASTIVTIADDGLEIKIRETLQKPTGDITAADIESIKELYLEDSDITDLTGLQYAASLEVLILDNNKVKTLAPLKPLKNLVELSAVSNYLEDISALQDMTKLEYIDLNDNYISKIDSLKNLTNLQILGLYANLISDVTPLSALTNLQVLEIGYNNIKDISKLSNLTNMSYLSLRGNSISDITPLKDMNYLEVLELQNNNISDIAVINTLKANGAFTYEESAVDLRYNYLDLSNGSQQATYVANLKAGSTEVITDNQFSSLTPEVTFSDPGNGELSFPGNLPITLYFDRPVVAGLGIGHIRIVGNEYKIISTTTTIENNKITITPNEKLAYGEKYILQVPFDAIRSKADNSKGDDYTVVFTTASSDTTKLRVAFNSQGGTAVAAQSADNNTAITAPAVPTRTGYTFGGWYKDAACTSPWNFSTDKVTAYTTLYAKWTINTYTVTFNSNGGPAIASQSIVYSNKVGKPADPTKAGYKFGGWYTDQFPFKTVFDFTKPLTGNVTLYARWVPTEAYIISYVQQAQDTKLFGIYNQAKAVIMESDLSEAKKGIYLGKIAKLDTAVFTDNNKYFINRCIAIAANPNLTDFHALLDEIDAKIANNIDRGYFKGQMDSWGHYRVYTPEVLASINAIIEVWTVKTPESVTTAKTAIAKVKEAGSVTWLNKQLDEAVSAMSK